MKRAASIGVATLAAVSGLTALVASTGDARDGGVMVRDEAAVSTSADADDGGAEPTPTTDRPTVTTTSTPRAPERRTDRTPQTTTIDHERGVRLKLSVDARAVRRDETFRAVLEITNISASEIVVSDQPKENYTFYVESSRGRHDGTCWVGGWPAVASPPRRLQPSESFTRSLDINSAQTTGGSGCSVPPGENFVGAWVDVCGAPSEEFPGDRCANKTSVGARAIAVTMF